MNVKHAQAFVQGSYTGYLLEHKRIIPQAFASAFMPASGKISQPTGVSAVAPNVASNGRKLAVPLRPLLQCKVSRFLTIP
jgi:hypothetical protein